MMSNLPLLILLAAVILVVGFIGGALVTMLWYEREKKKEEEPLKPAVKKKRSAAAAQSNPGQPVNTAPVQEEEKPKPPQPAPQIQQTKPLQPVTAPAPAVDKPTVNPPGRTQGAEDPVLETRMASAVKPASQAVSVNPVASPAAVSPPTASQPPAKTETKPRSIVEQIDEVLQELLVQSNLENKGIRLVEDPREGVIVWIGLEKFPGVDSVKDLEVQKMIRRAVKEWEEKVSRKS